MEPPPTSRIYVTEAPPPVIFVRVQVSHISCGGIALKLCGLLIFERNKLVASKKRAQQLRRWATVPEHSGSKSGGCCAPFRGGAESPSNTMSPGPSLPLHQVAS